MDTGNIDHKEFFALAFKAGCVLFYSAIVGIVGGVLPIMVSCIAFIPLIKRVPESNFQRRAVYLGIAVFSFVVANLVVGTPYEIRVV
jgi:hypothetical protein